MRKTLEAISLAVLAFQIWIFYSAVYGPSRLPDRVPIHFDSAGHVNGWGSPTEFLFLPVVAAAIYLLLTVVARFPASFNYPVEVTDENRPRLEALVIDMLAWLKAELVCLFAGILWIAIQAAHQPARPSAAPIIAHLVVVFATIVYFIVAMFRAARSQANA
jgi:uncharacterized membrane protein